MNPLPLTLALGPYDHTRDVTDGTVRVEGVQLRTLDLPIEEIFYRFTLHREWDVSEMSMGSWVTLHCKVYPEFCLFIRHLSPTNTSQCTIGVFKVAS